MGETIKISGKATAKEKPHDLNQMETRSSIKPTFNTLIFKDMIPDIRNAMKNENKTLWYFLSTIIEITTINVLVSVALRDTQIHPMQH